MGGLKDFDATVDNRVESDWIPLVQLLLAHGVEIAGRECLEVGTGWHPVLPVCFSLAGTRLCHTIDRVAHMSEHLSFRMMRRIETHLPAIACAAQRPLEDVTRRYSDLMAAGSLQELLQRARIRYVAPGDASRTGLPDGSVDLVFSNNVLEHVYPDEITTMMEESRRILKPGGLSVHCVACNDHYAHFDHSITFVNYLQYPAAQWNFWNNGLHYQNRLRACDFVRRATTAGLEVVAQKVSESPGVRAALSKFDIAPEFSGYSTDELVATSITFLAQSPVVGRR
jgi:SAM-dependent methyltransferase